MQAIGKSKGGAREYSRFSCNPYYGCSHACNYNKNGGCYAAAMAVRFGWFKSIKDFQENPRPKEGIIEALKIDAKKLAHKHKLSMKKWERNKSIYPEPGVWLSLKPSVPFVLLSFMTDPYQPINQEYQLTRQAIEILHNEGLGVNILTKGVVTDFDLLAQNPHLSKVGITYSGGRVYDYEPNASFIINRLDNLKLAKKLNIKTWVSMEPVVCVDHCKAFIECHYNLIDEIKIGKWNYNPEARNIDWYKFGHEVEKLCQKLGVNYYIKEGLRKEMEKEV